MATDWGAIISLAGQGLGAAGQIAAARSAARAQGRQADAAANMSVDQYNQQNYGANQNAMLTAGSMAEAARLDRAKLGMEAPEVRTKQALYGDLIRNLSDAKLTGMGAHVPKVSISGGLRPSAISAAGREAAGSALQTQAMQALLSGSDVPDMPDFSKLVLTPPEATPLPQAGTEDRWLNTLAAIGAAAQAGQQIYNSRPRAENAPVATNQPVDFGNNAMRGVRF